MTRTYKRNTRASKNGVQAAGMMHTMDEGGRFRTSPERFNFNSLTERDQIMQKKFVSLLAAALFAAPLASAFAADGVKPRGLEVDDNGRSSQTQFAKASGNVRAGNIGVDTLGRAAAQPAAATVGNTLLSGGNDVSAISRG
jgi:hypothetical protein